MVVLGIDTATWTAAVGVVRDGIVLADVHRAESRSHVVSLPGLVRAALAEAGAGVADVQAIAVSIGPGSFTGLRIGLALAKGMAYAGGVPLVGVPTLEALARVAEASPGDTVCAALDARKGECWAGVFRQGDAGLVRVGEDRAVAPDVLAASLPPDALVVGDAAEVYGEAFAGRRVLPFATHHPRGALVARLGAGRLAAGLADDPGMLEPTYVRPSEAELARAGSR